jgi:endo-1,4-beta-D-glucanase Y
MKGLLTSLCIACFAVAPAFAQVLPAFAQVLPAFAQVAPTPLSRAVEVPGAATRAPAPALAGMLPDEEIWRAYKAKFVTEAGRVVDSANGLISHSEGQGYGLLLAVAARDRFTFDRIWGWTRANLAVRNDELLAWRWEPDHRPAVADLNDAADGDILIAWALTEAAEAWSEDAYRVAARRIAVEVGRRLILWKSANGAVLLPAAAGFAAEDRSDGPIVSLSYYIFPAFARLGLAAPEFDWQELSRSGLHLIETSRFGEPNLPVEWISLAGGTPHAADGFAASFAYNSIRIPLYLAWSGVGGREDYEPFLAAWSKQGPENLATLDVTSGRSVDRLDEAGYAAIPALVSCVTSGTSWPAKLKSLQPGGNYYSTTLQLLSLVAVRMRAPSCLQG